MEWDEYSDGIYQRYSYSVMFKSTGSYTDKKIRCFEQNFTICSDIFIVLDLNILVFLEETVG